MSAAIRFGRYVLLDRLAIGGMAELFLAKAVGEAGFEKVCVIKRVLPHLASDPQFVQMFLDEAKLAARLNHPNIVQIFDFGRIEADYFLAMEYLAGEDGSAIVERRAALGRPVPIEVAVTLVAEAAAALAYAHELTGDDGHPLGIVHRDVSPSNLFVSYEGTIKLLDFGIARAETRGHRTKTGTIKGKTPYIAPELLLGGTVDRRADVWSLGLCLHELLTGQRIFARDLEPKTILAVCRGPIPPASALRHDIPIELDAIIERALSRDLQQRWPDADALRRALDELPRMRATPAAITQFMRGTFGEQRIAQRTRSASHVRGEPAARTEQLEGGRGAPDSKRAINATAPARRARSAARVWSWARPRGWLFLLSALCALVMAFVAGLLVQRQAPLPPWAGPRRNDPRMGATTRSAAAATDAARPRSRPAAETKPRASKGAWSASSARTAPPALERAAERSEDRDAPKPRTSRRLGISVARKRTRAIKLTKPEPTGSLRVEANAPVSVWLDGRPLGEAPAEISGLVPKVHTVLLANRRLGLSRRVRLNIEPAQQTIHRAHFGKATLNVSVDPWADVYLDGVRIGQTPLAGRQVWEGRHLLRLINGEREKTVTIEAAAGQSIIVRETL